MVTYTEKQKCYQRYRYALYHGELSIPELCQQCNCKPKKALHGHHNNYSKPLDVIWACVKCHGRLDKSRRLNEVRVRCVDPSEPKVVTVKIPESLDNQVEHAVIDLGMTKQQFLEAAIRRAVETHCKTLGAA